MARTGLHTAHCQQTVEGPDPGHTKGIQMTQAQERIERKAGKTVTTLAQAIAAYGGRGPFREAFCISDDQLDDWQRWGDITRGAQLGLLLGLRARGYTMAPQLVGVDSWADVAGV